METYLVGGAVRDKLLSLDVFDKDYVVVGGSSEAMLLAGFKQVGKDFPVFLHPKTHQEYALARVEKKVAAGYKGFEVQTKGVSLEDDLSRRDLTINAMAIKVNQGQENQSPTIIDPFNGQQDLAMGLLKHVSPAFNQDPVRILRVARFAARFKPFGFKVAHKTHQLMCDMVVSGEVNSLVPERVWAELEKALGYQAPSIFFKVLHACGALTVVFPGLLDNQPITHHNDFAWLDNINTNNIAIKWAILCHHLLPKQVNDLSVTITCPKAVRRLAILTATYIKFSQHLTGQSSDEVLRFYLACGAFRRHNRFDDLLAVFDHLTVDTNLIRKIWQALLAIDISQLNQANIATELPKARQAIIEQHLKGVLK